MKGLFKASVFGGILIFLIACQLTSQAVPSSNPSPIATSTPTVTRISSQATTATVGPTATQAYIPPTLIPTIDPTLVPELLSKAFSVRTMQGANGRTLRRITGWDYGFRQFPDDGYQWLDSNHLLLYPRTGEGMEPFMDGSRREDLSSQPVIVNLENGHLWLPQSNMSTSLNFSRELGIIIKQGLYGSAFGPTKEAVFIYTFDGEEVARFWGKILGVSPNGTKILVDDDTIIDLSNHKTIDLAWYMNYDLERSPQLYWSSDETRVYRCCFYFADLKTGKSYNFEWADLRGVDEKPVSSPMYGHNYGQWVRNNTYFLIEWNYFLDYSADDIPLFSPVEKKYYDLVKMAGVPASLTSTYTVSPDGMYVWIKNVSEADGATRNFLVSLTSFETVTSDAEVIDVEWSPDSQFAGLSISPFNGPSEVQLFSVSSKKMEPSPLGSLPLWRPNDHIFAYLAGDKLELMDAQTKSTRDLPLPTTFQGFVWSPNGDHIALEAKDGSLWQVDYPKLENLEQLTPSLPDVIHVNWSSDGNSIAFISDSDLYVVEANK